MSGTFNMAHPDPAVRRDGLTKFEVLCGITARFRIPDITLCTGTRDPVNMWKWHSDNDSKGARADMVQSIESALIAAEKNNLVLAFEPESENVVNSSRRCASASSARTIFSVGARRSLLTRPSLERVQIIHSFRAIGITVYLENKGTLETAQKKAVHESPRTTKQKEMKNMSSQYHSSTDQPATLEQETRNTIEEARMVLPGIQAIFGFQLIAVAMFLIFFGLWFVFPWTAASSDAHKENLRDRSLRKNIDPRSLSNMPTCFVPQPTPSVPESLASSSPEDLTTAPPGCGRSSSVALSGLLKKSN